MIPLHLYDIKKGIRRYLRKRRMRAMNAHIQRLIAKASETPRPKPAIAFLDLSDRIRPPCGKCPGCRAYFASLN